MVTLTTPPDRWPDMETACRALKEAWASYVRWYRKQPGREPLEYGAVVEATKKGTPHLHIPCRSGYIPQAELAAWMQPRVGCEKPWIDRIKHQGKACHYLASYLKKDPAKYGTLKRYNFSFGYRLDREAGERLADRIWQVHRIRSKAQHLVNAELRPLYAHSWDEGPLTYFSNRDPPLETRNWSP